MLPFVLPHFLGAEMELKVRKDPHNHKATLPFFGDIVRELESDEETLLSESLDYQLVSQLISELLDVFKADNSFLSILFTELAYPHHSVRERATLLSLARTTYCRKRDKLMAEFPKFKWMLKKPAGIKTSKADTSQVGRVVAASHPSKEGQYV